MKKITLLALAAIAFTGCSDDDSNSTLSGTDLTGTYKTTKCYVGADENGNEYEPFDITDCDNFVGEPMLYNFLASGDYTQVKACDNSVVVNDATYTLNNGILTLETESGTKTYRITNQGNNTLKMDFFTEGSNLGSANYPDFIIQKQ